MSGLRFYALGFVGFLRYGLLILLEDVPRHAGLRFVTTVGGSCATCGELRAVGSAGSEDGHAGLDEKSCIASLLLDARGPAVRLLAGVGAVGGSQRRAISTFKNPSLSFFC